MNSNLAKYIAAHYLIYEKNYIGAITEYSNCDVVGIKRSLYTSEIEIKLTKSDLLKELRIIRSILSGNHPIKGASNKVWKHQSYLKIFKREWSFNPNEFSFYGFGKFKRYFIEWNFINTIWRILFFLSEI